MTGRDKVKKQVGFIVGDEQKTNDIMYLIDGLVDALREEYQNVHTTIINAPVEIIVKKKPN